MENKVYETSIRYFLNNECRIVITDFEDCTDEENQWLPIKDMFSCLDRLDAKGNVTSHDSSKVKEYMNNVEWGGDHKELMVASNNENKFANKTVKLTCVRLNRVPSLIPLFEPPVNSPRYDIYKGYIHYISDLLMQNRILEKLFIKQQSKKEALRQFEGILFTLAQVAPNAKCKNGKDLKQLLVQMHLIEIQSDKITDYDATFFNCTDKTVRVKAINLQELVNTIAQYKKDNDIEDYVPKKRKAKKKLRCKNTGAEFSTLAQAAEYGNTGSTSIRNYLKGLQAYAGKLDTGEKLKWEWVKVEE